MRESQRTPSYLDVTIHNTVASAEAVDFKNFAGGRVCFGSGIAIATINIYELDPVAGTYVQAMNADGTALQITGITASKTHTLPLECFAMLSLKLVPTASTDDGETVTVILKS